MWLFKKTQQNNAEKQKVQPKKESFKATPNSAKKTIKTFLKEWGQVETLLDEDSFEVRRITIHPGKQTSMHRHFNRREYWWIKSGGGLVEISDDPSKYTQQQMITSDKEAVINQGRWHRITNNSKEVNLVIIEFAIGNVSEEDCERWIY